MITIGPKYVKLKTSLQLAISRSKLLQAKKYEQSEKLKQEVSDHLKNGKFTNAIIKSHSIIREDATIEALEIIEMYCEQLLERYELFRQMSKPDVSLLTVISSLIWVAPYYQTHIEELKCIAKQLEVKYGNRFCRLALTNQSGQVDPQLMNRVRYFTSTEDKIEDCVIDICNKFGINYDVVKEATKNSKGSWCKTTKKPGCSEKAEGVEFQADGIGQLGGFVSTKKAFNEIMGKQKNLKVAAARRGSKKTNSVKSTAKECLPGNPSESLDRNHQHAFAFSSSVKLNEAEEYSLMNKNMRGLIMEGAKDIVDLKQEVYNSSEGYTHDSNIQKLRGQTNENDLVHAYPDPAPPPYSEVDDHQIEGEGTKREKFLVNQPPTCPTEYPSEKK